MSDMLQKLGALLDGIKYEKLPAETIEKTKTAVINFFGGSFPAVNAALTKAETAMWDSVGSQGVCTVLGSKKTTSALAAAAINAAMGESYLCEDCDLVYSGSHPGMIVIPVCMALGQEMKSTGRQIIEAIVTGYEALGRIGIVLNVDDFAKNGLRPASIIGVFGGAVAAAKLMGLGGDGIARAISIAGNTSSGTSEFVNAGTVDICLQNCFSTKNSMMAALLAREGIQGAPTVLDGRYGLGLALTNRTLDWDKVTDPKGCRGDGSYVMDTTFIKAFPGCAHVQATAEAAMNLVRAESFTAQDVQSAEVGVCGASQAWPGCDSQGPYNGTISAMMSHQFMIAAAIINNEITPAVVDEFADPEKSGLAKKITVYVDADIDRTAKDTGHVELGARLAVRLKDGRRVFSSVQSASPLDREGAIARLNNTSAAFIRAEQAKRIISLAEKLDGISDINELMFCAQT